MPGGLGHVTVLCSTSRVTYKNANSPLRRYDKFPQFPVVVIRRVTQAAEIQLRTVVQNAARVCVGAKSPLAMVLTHAGIPDASKWQVVNDRLHRAVVDRRIPRGGRGQHP